MKVGYVFRVMMVAMVVVMSMMVMSMMTVMVMALGEVAGRRAQRSNAKVLREFLVAEAVNVRCRQPYRKKTDEQEMSDHW